jgi:hypothetical protein
MCTWKSDGSLDLDPTVASDVAEHCTHLGDHLPHEQASVAVARVLFAAHGCDPHPTGSGQKPLDPTGEPIGLRY